MKKTLSFIGAAIYSALVSYLIWIIFRYLTPWLISWSWLAIIIYLILANGLIFSLIGGICRGLAIPLFPLCDIASSSKYLPILFLAVGGCCSVAIPWRLHPQGFKEILIAIDVTIMVLSIFIGIIAALAAYAKLDE